MYERFSDRARKVMQLANQEAQRFNHEYIGTEHILLGLAKEGSGVAAHVLKNLDIDLRKIRLEVEKVVLQGPDMVTMGKLPQTPRAKKVIEYSITEARELNHNYVGTEHLLLGLLREGEGVACQVLTNLGVKIVEVREEVLSLLGCKTKEKTEFDTKYVKVQEIEAEIEKFNKQKEDFVSKCDFENAAKFRDQAFKLKKERDELKRKMLLDNPSFKIDRLRELVGSVNLIPESVEVVILKKTVWDEIVKLISLE